MTITPHIFSPDAICGSHSPRCASLPADVGVRPLTEDVLLSRPWHILDRIVDTLQLDLKPIPVIAVESNRMHQALGNMLTNAEEAMPGGGVVLIGLERTTLVGLLQQPPERQNEEQRAGRLNETSAADILGYPANAVRLLILCCAAFWGLVFAALLRPNGWLCSGASPRGAASTSGRWGLATRPRPRSGCTRAWGRTPSA